MLQCVIFFFGGDFFSQVVYDVDPKFMNIC